MKSQSNMMPPMKNEISIQMLQGFLQAMAHYPTCGEGFAYESRIFAINEAEGFESIPPSSILPDDFPTILLLWFIGKEGESKNPASLQTFRQHIQPPETDLNANFVYRSSNAVDDFMELLASYMGTQTFEVYNLSGLVAKDYPMQEVYLIKTERKKVILSLGLTD